MATEPGNDSVLREAARDLVDTLRPYRVLTRHELADLSREAAWKTVGFDEALRWAVEHGYLRPLGSDLYEIPPDRE